MRVSLVIGVVVALVAASGGSARSSSPSAYLTHALALMRSQAVVAPTGGWAVVVLRARRMAAKARTDAQTYGAILYAIQSLYEAGDVHARFANPLMAKLAAQGAKAAGTTLTPPPTVSTLAGGKIGVVRLPAIGSLPNTPNARRYETVALTSISAVQRANAPCGWIVDLRGNTGGDMYPMLLSLGPIIGNGPLIGFQSRDGFSGYVSYNNGVLSVGRDTFSAPIAPITPPPPVALLTDGLTLSSGEAVTVAFHGRADVQSFGAATGGAPTSPQTYRLSDGATISFSTANDVDRNGIKYTGPISPDQQAEGNPADSADTTNSAAAWLLATPACAAK